ncbi:cyclopropane-fatty-acyl-phospholipid synthase [Hoeflea sp. YIM 152468]|uniref:SAM-dependent methyltransferase n=1 Tax=Hoeflea sp. YIM 152468 TaxID=3031759 RepID=UPI0023DBD382|nr:cyclopropane-fatty-acyl-phospholipid synthase family protein [Hoeflea sp. YIM 152468]MDF1609864.1 cyclopropane-fatty-acyl-phospholipid synthase [Hoeflea sp. YIM 152468]
MKTEATWTGHQRPEKLSTDNLSGYLRGLPAKAKMALRGLLHMAHGRLSIRMPDGRTVLIEGRSEGPDAVLILHNWNLTHQALTAGTIGVAESYMDGDWESPDVTAFLELFLVNVEVGNTLAGGARGVARLIEQIRHWLRSNSRTQAKKNISAHYDLGNAFYSKWLDETMTYSSALYSDGANDLAGAQTAKYRALAQAAGLKRGDHVLEIGCGWGGFAEFAAGEIGCRVTGLTISNEQLAFARRRIEAAGLSDKVDLRFQDYRDETGRYDGVVSIEMFEAVGEKYWPAYFSKVRQCLKPGGRAGLQIITIKPEAYEAYRANPDFIQRYVFPGGMLPTENHLKSLGEAAGLELVGHRAFGPDYGRTLAEWRQRFRNVWHEVQPMGFDLRFKRLWEFYMYYCEAGFRSGHINVRQVVYS